MARRLRVMLAILAVGALVGACGSDDESGSDATSSTSAGDEVLVQEPCEVLDQQDLSQVTGLEFDQATPSLNTCIYTSSSGRSAIAVNFRSIGDKDPDEALAAARGQCEEGTVQELELADSDGGFGCLVGGVPTVVATGEGIVAILTGSTLNPGVDAARILQDLATILDHAVQSGVD